MSRRDVHTVSRNAGTTKPAKFVVFFVKQTGTPFTAPADGLANKSFSVPLLSIEGRRAAERKKCA